MMRKNQTKWVQRNRKRKGKKKGGRRPGKRGPPPWHFSDLSDEKEIPLCDRTVGLQKIGLEIDVEKVSRDTCSTANSKKRERGQKRVRMASAQGADQAPMHGRQVHAAQFQSIPSTKNKRSVSKSFTGLGETALRTLDGVV